TFIALLGAPALWRRAAAVTRRRIEASTPLTREELAAEADRVRAEAAMSMRRLEIELKAAREKAAQHRIEASRCVEEIKSLRETVKRLRQTETEQTAQLTALREKLHA